MNIQCMKCSTTYRIDDRKIPSKGGFIRCVKCDDRILVKPKPDCLSDAPPPEALFCKHCSRQIGAPENPHTFNGFIVCYDCYTHLHTDSRPSHPKFVDSSGCETENGDAAPNNDSNHRNGFSKFLGFLTTPITGLFSNNLAIDLGTANTLIYIKKKGIVLNEPSVVALRTNGRYEKKIIAIGSEAKKMLGKTPSNISAIRPMREGVIADFEVAAAMLKHFIQKAYKRWTFAKPTIIVAVPSGITQVEKRAVEESAKQAGAKRVFLIEESMAAAIGAELAITEPTCNMVIDIGGGTTEIAVISLAGFIAAKSLKVAGNEMDAAIIRYIRNKYNFIIGEKTAETVKIEIGDLCPNPQNVRTIEIKGWEVVSGSPKIFMLNSEEIKEAISEQIHTIIENAKLVLDQTPQELTSEVVENGIVLTGGGALLKNLDKYISQKIGIPIKVAKDPLATVALGSGKALDNMHIFRQVILS